MPTDMPANPALPERPNLENDSITIATVKGVGLGAVIGGIVEAGMNIAETVADRQKLSIASLLKSSAKSAAIVGASLGTASLVVTRIKNYQNGIVRPYVEKLEREVLAKNASADAPAPQR